MSGPLATARRPGARVVAGAIGVPTVAILPVFLLGGLAVLVRRDLGFSETGLGAAVAIYFTAAALSSAVTGRAVERIGARAASFVAVGLAAATLLGVAFLARSWMSLAALLALGGAANSFGQMGANLALARGVSDRRQGLAFGVKQSAIPLATLLGGLAVPALGLTLGWRWAFAAGALLAPVALLVPPGTGRPRERVDRRADGDAPAGALAVLAVGVALGAGATNPLGSFLVESSVVAGVAPGAAGLLLAGGSVVGLSMRLLTGWVADNRDGRHLLVVAGHLVLGAGGFALLAAATRDATGGAVPLLVLGTVLAYGLGWSWPGLFNFAVVRLNPAAPAAATGITATGGFAGNAVGPLAFGLAVERLGYPAAWTGAGVALLLGAGFLLLGRRLLR